MLIEFSGVDGSGKSTLLSHLRGFLNEHSVPCAERQMRSTYKRLLADIASQAGHSHWRHLFTADEVELAAAMEMWTLVSSTIAPLDHRRQVILTDTYIRRWLATAHRWKVGNLDRLAQIYRRMPAPDLSFHLTVDPEHARRRLLDRPTRDQQVNLRDSARLEAYASSFAQVADLVPYQTLVLSTDRPLADTVAEIFDAVRAWDADHYRLLPTS